MSEYYAMADGVPTSETISLGDFYSTSADTYWAAGWEVQNAVDDENVKHGALAIDDAQNVYTFNKTNSENISSSQYTAQSTKRNRHGSVSYDTVGYTVEGTGSASFLNGSIAAIAADDGTRYMLCLGTFLSKWNSNGTLAWSKDMANTTPRALSFDSSGNIIVVGVSSDPNSGQPVAAWDDALLITKWNTSGSLVWSKVYKPPTPANNANPEARGVKLDSSDNIYVFGRVHNLDPNNSSNVLSIDTWVAKFNSSATSLLWEHRYQPPSGAFSSSGAFDLLCHSSGDIYLAGTKAYQYTANSYWQDGGFIVKMNSSGTRSWAREHNNLIDYSKMSATGLAEDSSGNVYAVYAKQDKGVYYAQINTSNGNWLSYRFFDFPAHSSGWAVFSFVWPMLKVKANNAYIYFSARHYEDDANGDRIDFFKTYLVKYPRSGSTTGNYPVFDSTLQINTSASGTIDTNSVSPTVSVGNVLSSHSRSHSVSTRSVSAYTMSNVNSANFSL